MSASSNLFSVPPSSVRRTDYFRPPSLRSNPESCRFVRRPPVIWSPGLLCRPEDQFTSGRLPLLSHQGMNKGHSASSCALADSDLSASRSSPRPDQNQPPLRPSLRSLFQAAGLAAFGSAGSASLRRLILCSCSFLVDQRISLIRFAPSVRPSARARISSAPLCVLQ